jgi:DNA-binding MarR family transcriptional regulator
MNVKIRHYNGSTADNNRERIYKIIERGLTTGVVQKEIQAETGLTRPPVSYHLKELERQEKIYYKNSEDDKKIKIYFPQDRDIANINTFSRSIEEAGIHIIDRGLIEPRLENLSDEEVSGWKDCQEPYPRLCGRVINITVSDKYCKTHFKRDVNEKLLFEFVNRAGAFMAYIFIELMRPPADNNFDSSQDKRNKLGSILLNNAINIQEMFQQFCLLFQSPGVKKEEINTRRRYPEVDDSSFSNLQEVFRNLYPKIYDGLEEWWKSHAKYFLSVWYRQMAEKSDCPHKWEKTYLYKYGKCYRCYKCALLVNTPVVNETVKKRRLG